MKVVCTDMDQVMVTIMQGPPLSGAGLRLELKVKLELIVLTLVTSTSI